jgi:hypothetical protein
MTGGNAAGRLGGRSTWVGRFAGLVVAAVTIAALVVWPGAGRGDAARPGPSPTPTPTPTGTPGIVTPPQSIPSDCSVGVTSQLSNWLATVPDFSTITFPAGACYRIDETLVIGQRTGLTFEGNGATFRTVTDGTESPSPRTRAHWRMLNATDITIRNLVIAGPNTLGTASGALEAQHAFEVKGGLRVTISDVEVKEVFGDAVNVTKSFGGKKGDSVPERDSEEVLVEDSDLERIGRHGISVTSARRVTLRANTLSGASRSAVDLEPTASNTPVEDVSIESNTFSGYANFMVAGAGACGSFRNITIRDNTATGGGIRIGKMNCLPRENLLVEANTVTLPTQGVGTGFLIVVNLSGMTVRNNVAILNKPGPGVFLQSGAGTLVVADNSFCGATAAVAADASGPVTQTGNIINC